MNLPRALSPAVKATLLGLLLIVCLGSEFPHRATLPWPLLNQVHAEVFATFQAVDVQWLIVICLSVYFLGFIWLHRSWNRGVSLCRDVPMIVGLALYAIGALAYALNYDQASRTTDALLFFFGIALFFGLRFWRAVEAKRNQPFNLAGVVVVFMLILLCVGAVWHSDSVQSFQYRGQARWSGLWGNPNTFGILMGLGVVLAVGQILSRVTRHASRTGCQEAGPDAESSTFNLRRFTSPVTRHLPLPLLLAVGGLCGVGLVKSYSRGAWLGTACGLLYLAWQMINREIHELHETASPSPPGGRGERTGVRWALVRHQLQVLSHPRIWRLSRLRSVWLPISVILASVFVLAFWNFRHTERLVARRAFSVGNVNDFSWRNRVAAWDGSLQMMASKPWLGFGWNQPERVYDQLYRPAKVAEAAAIQMNDYFTLGTILGVPALVCFVTFIGLALSLKSKVQSPKSVAFGVREARGERREPVELQSSDFRLQTSAFGDLSPVTRHLSLSSICRAGAVVLLVGFWFDAGLFKLATATVFWILLELGSGNGPETRRIITI